MPKPGVTYDVVLDPEGENVGLLLKPGGWQARQANPFAAKMSATERTYADFDQWSVAEQATFHHGALQEEMDDAGMYLQGNLDTRFKGRAILPPAKRHEAAGTGSEYRPGNVSWINAPYLTRYAQSFVALAVDTPCTHVWVYGYGMDPASFMVELRADNAGSPGTLKASKYGSISPGGWKKLTWDSAQTLTPTSRYWVVYYRYSGAWAYAGYDAAAGYAEPAKKSVDGGTNWTAWTGSLYFRINNGKVSVDDITGPFVTFLTDEYVIGSDAIYKHDDTNSDWDDAVAGLAANGSDMAVFNANLYVAQGDANAMRKTANGAAWANIGGTGAAQQATALAVHGGMFYKARANTVQYTADPSAATPSWSAAITVGSSDYGVKKMLPTHWGLLCIKSDGCWLIAGNPAQNDRAYRVDALAWETRPDEANGKAACVWSDGCCYIAEGGGGLVRWDGEVATPVGPDRGTGIPSPFSGNIVALIPHTNFLYACVDAGDVGQSSVWAYNGGWHRLIEADAAGYRMRALGYTVAHTPRRLLFGEGKGIGYVPMSDISDNPQHYSAAEYLPSASLITSKFTMGLPGTEKEFYQLLVVGEDVDATHPVLAEYQVDEEGTWYVLGTVERSGPVVLPLPRATFAAKTAGASCTTTTINLLTGSTTTDMVAGDWIYANGEYRQVASITDSDTFVLHVPLAAAPASGDDVYPGLAWGNWVRYRLALRTDDTLETPVLKAVACKYLANVRDQRTWRVTGETYPEQKMRQGQALELAPHELRAALWRIAKKGRITCLPPDYAQSGESLTVKVTDWSEYIADMVTSESDRPVIKWTLTLSLLEVA